MTIETARSIAELLNERNNLMTVYNYDLILQNANNYRYILLENELVAVAEIKKVQWYQFEIKHVSVKKEFEGKGFGSKIIKVAEEEAINKNGKIIQCTIRVDNTASINLFERNGYLLVNKFYNNESKNQVNIYQKIITKK